MTHVIRVVALSGDRVTEPLEIATSYTDLVATIEPNCKWELDWGPPMFLRKLRDALSPTAARGAS